MVTMICLPMVRRSFGCISSLSWRYSSLLGLSSAHGSKRTIATSIYTSTACCPLLPHRRSFTFLISLISLAFTLLSCTRPSIHLILIITFFLLQYSSQRVLLKTIVRTYNHHIRGRSVIRITRFDCLWRQNQSLLSSDPLRHPAFYTLQ